MPQNGPELRDIHVPQVSAWWPLAPGWWLLLALVVVAMAVAVVVVRRRRAWRRRVDTVLRELRRAVARHAEDGDVAAFAAGTSALVRRVARTRDPHSVVLSGAGWRDALVTMAPGCDVEPLVRLDGAKYLRRADLDVDVDVDAVASAVESWIRAAMRRPVATTAIRPGRRAHVAS